MNVVFQTTLVIYMYFILYAIAMYVLGTIRNFVFTKFELFSDIYIIYIFCYSLA